MTVTEGKLSRIALKTAAMFKFWENCEVKKEFDIAAVGGNFVGAHNNPVVLNLNCQGFIIAFL